MLSNETERRARFEAVANDVFEPVQRYLLRRAPAHTAEDVLSEVLLVVWRRLEVVPQDNPLPWCYSVARRILANHRRSDQRRLRLVDRMESEPKPQLPTVEGPDTLATELEAAMETLRPDDRELIRLWAWEQLEPREIALVLQSTPNAVSLRLTRLKQKLLAELERQNALMTGHIPDKHAKEM